MCLRGIPAFFLLTIISFGASADTWYSPSPLVPATENDAQGNAPQLPRLDPKDAASRFYVQYLHDRRFREMYLDLEGFITGKYRGGETGFKFDDAPDIDEFIESKVSSVELRDWIQEFFAATDKRVAEVNRLVGIAEDAARRCDRPAYDDAIRQLISAYVQVSLYIQRTLDQFESLAQAAGEFERGETSGPTHLEVSRTLRRGWVAFWQEVLYYERTLSLQQATPVAVSNEVQIRAKTEHRARALADGYMYVYRQLHEHVEHVLANAKYPPYGKDCDEPVDMDMSFLDLEDGEAELEAAREALREFEREAAEYEENVGRIRDAISGMAVEDEPVGMDAADVAPLAPSAPEATPAASPALPPAPVESEAVFWTQPDMEQIVANIPKTNLPQIDATASGPVADMRADPCDLDAQRVCSVLLAEYRVECGRELKAFLSICRKGPSVSDCAERCALNWQQGKHDLALADLAQRQIDKFAAGAEAGGRERAFEEAEEELAANKRLIEDIRKRGAERVVTIFINETSGAVIRHYGKPFEPYPPLRLAGTEPVGLHLNEELTIEDIEARNRYLEEEMERLVEDLHAGNDWARMAMSKWRADPDVPDGRCTARQNDENREACLASCKGGIPAGTVNMCHGSVVPQLALPYGRGFLYPPGDPRGAAAPVTVGRVQP